MKYYLVLIVVSLLSVGAQAESFSERIKITGFLCENQKIRINLRSLETDRFLYLAKNNPGTPEYLEAYEEDCEEWIKYYGRKLSGQTLEVVFNTDIFNRKESVSVPPLNPCGERFRPKCDNTRHFVEKRFQYLRTETTIENFKFLNEQRLEE